MRTQYESLKRVEKQIQRLWGILKLKNLKLIIANNIIIPN